VPFARGGTAVYNEKEPVMITLHRLNDTEFVLNCDLIETVNENPDTTIRLTTGNIYIVREGVEEVIRATVRYKRSLFEGMLRRDEI
jgi:flagellar protein FlbD